MIIQAAPPGVHVHVVPIKQALRGREGSRALATTQAMLLFETPQDCSAPEGVKSRQEAATLAPWHTPPARSSSTNALAMDQDDVDTLKKIK
jgi:PTS system mannose-specific IIB component